MEASNDPREIGRANKRKEFDAWQQAEEIRFVLSDARGRRFLHRLMLSNGLYDPAPVGSNALQAWEGRRSTAVALRGAIFGVNMNELHRMEAEWVDYQLALKAGAHDASRQSETEA